MLPSSGLNGGSIVQVTACRLPFTAKTSAGTLWQVDGRKVLPDEVSQLERFRGETVTGGRQERTPGTLLRGFRGRWTAGRDTWNTFAGIPWQVGSRKMPPDTLSRGFRGRWTARRDTRNTFAGIPWQVGSRKMPPDTLSRGFRGRWTAGRDTWNTFAGIPCQVGGREMPPDTLSREFCARCVPHLQGHTVALRRSFPHSGPLPFSGADAGFGHSMSLPSRIILT